MPKHYEGQLAKERAFVDLLRSEFHRLLEAAELHCDVCHRKPEFWFVEIREEVGAIGHRLRIGFEGDCEHLGDVVDTLYRKAREVAAKETGYR